MPLIAYPNEAVLSIIKTLNHRTDKWHFCDCDYYFVSNGECYVFCQSISFWMQVKDVYVRLEISDDIGLYPYSSFVEYEMAFSNDLGTLMSPKASCDIKKLWRVSTPILEEAAKDYEPFTLAALGKLAKKAFASVDFVHHNEFLSTSRHELATSADEFIRSVEEYEPVITAFCAILNSNPFEFHRLAEKCSKEQELDSVNS